VTRDARPYRTRGRMVGCRSTKRRSSRVFPRMCLGAVDANENAKPFSRQRTTTPFGFGRPFGSESSGPTCVRRLRHSSATTSLITSTMSPRRSARLRTRLPLRNRQTSAAFFGNRRLNEITTALVKSFETKLKRRGYALATVNDYLNVLLMLLHRAVDDFDLIEEFPIKKRLKRKRPEPLALELTEDERSRFLSAFDVGAAFRKT